jgi:predicted DsbA family dithiol-disulfide isomerase
MKIEIWSDIACPWCYVGKRRFESALTDFPQRDELQIIWRSFELNPTAPPRAERPTVELIANKYGMPVARAQAMMDDMTATGAADGIAFRFDRSISGNTFDAHRLLHLAATRGLREAMVERLFAAYFTDGEAIADRDTLARLAGEVGLDAAEVRDMLASDAYAADVRADEARAGQLGITGVPFFAIDEKFGISGAQSAKVITDALMQAFAERE